jgi:hypothetical protein
MAHDLIWRVRDRAALERRFQLLFAGSERRDWAAKHLVQRFIEDVTLYPMEWPESAESSSNDEWRFGSVIVRFRRHPSDQMIEVLEVDSNRKAESSTASNGGLAMPVGDSGLADGPASVR